MEKYRKIKRIGIGSFGQALLVQSTVDRKYYVMKVSLPNSEPQIINVGNMEKKQKQDALNEVNFEFSYALGQSAESHETPLHHHLPREFHGQQVPVHRDGLRGRRRHVQENRVLEEGAEADPRELNSGLVRADGPGH